MIKNMKVEITMQDVERGRYYGIPVLPPTIQYTNGDTTANNVTIVDLGAVDIPNGRDLDSFSWSAVFPTRYDPGYVVIGKAALKSPIDYKNLFEGIKARKAPVQLICPVLGINKTMYIASFNPEFAGFEGDIKYSVTFRELRNIKPKKLTVGGTAPSKSTKQLSDRPAVPAPVKQKTYTVVSGDTVIKIAKKLGISDWRTNLYEPNKGVIGNDPEKLKPGQVLKL